MMAVGFLLMLGPLVTLHELGHYLVGRWCGVDSKVFSVGFGKELVGWTDRRGTRWRLSALPFGGYVQFKGDMNPASIADPDTPPEELEGAFQSASLWQRALIVAAGPVMNFLIAIAIFAAFAFAYGKPDITAPDTLVVGSFAEESAAQDAGVQEGDKVLSIDGDIVVSHEEVVNQIVLWPDRDIVLGIERDGRQIDIPMTIGRSEEVDRFGNEMVAGRLGVMFARAPNLPVGPLEAVGIGFTRTWDTLKMMLAGLWQIISGDRSVKELGGPITMAKYSGEQLSLGMAQFVAFVGFISINLAFINLLPIPALDGGHLAFYAAEAIRRRPASPRSQEWAFRTGMAFVLALMLFVTIIDIAKLPLFGS